MINQERICGYVDFKRDQYVCAADRIWDFAETRFEETQSAALLCDILDKEGFQITRGVAGVPTAFKATYGQGKPVIGILGEYDALGRMSQAAGLARREPLSPEGNGHGCGHHLLGVGSLAGVVAVKAYLEDSGMPGTVCYLGCPAEEGGSGKAFMARAGVFDDLDAALTWHPEALNATMCASTLANIQVLFKFHGVSAHASFAPHLGRSALDAVELMNVGVNYLREHILPDARVHYAVTNAGGSAPNVVQARADVLYLIRAPKLNQVREIYARVCDVASGAALMTGTRVEVQFDKAVSNAVVNETLCRLLQENMAALEAPSLPESEAAFAAEIWNSLDKAEQASAARFMDPALLRAHPEARFVDWLNPFRVLSTPLPASTDVGDVSWVTPTAQFVTACFALGTAEHSWQLVAQGKTEMAHGGMLYAAKVLALTAAQLMDSPDLIARSKVEFNGRLNGETYVCPIPPEVKPALTP